MATKLIKLEDGILVEVEIAPGSVTKIDASHADRVKSSMDKVEPILQGVSQSLTRVWQTISRDMEVEKFSVEVGISFEGEGNVFVTKTKASANLVVTLELKPMSKSASAPAPTSDQGNRT